ncbi:MAG TPA: PAS domain-containing protein, partial [Adhaeribacter sp.]|nr:PAS domain-containing protein [Adhaeribacter sp.]
MSISVLSESKSASRLLEVVSQLYAPSDPLVISDRFGIILAANQPAVTLFQLAPDYAGKTNLQEFINANAHLVTDKPENKPFTFSGEYDSVFSYTVKKISFDGSELFSFRIVPKFFKPSDAVLTEHGPAYHEIFEAADLAICVLGMSGEVLEANRAALDLVGNDKSKVLGRNLARILDLNPYEKDFFKSQLEKATTTKNSRFDWWVRSPDGQLVTVEVNLKSGFLPAG